MTRRMSVSMTIEAVEARIKTNTRRAPDTWVDLRPGEVVTLIEKGMGLPKGAKQVAICDVLILSNELEPIDAVTMLDVFHEGLGTRAMDAVLAGEAVDVAGWFRQFWCESHGHPKGTGRELGSGVECRNIKWRYLDEVAPMASECLTCGELADVDGECLQSKRPCGHHCNCSWIHDFCHWCDTELGEVEP